MSIFGEVRRSTVSSLATAVSAMLIAGAMGVLNFLQAVGRRRYLAQLGEFDDRMLKDIGLTRADLRDASSGPIWQDPTAVLVVRSVERRASQRQVARANLRLVSTQKGGQNLVSCG